MSFNSKKLTVAVCFSGALRSFKYCYDSINKYVLMPLQRKYNVLLFGHFWNPVINLDDIEYKMKWSRIGMNDTGFLDKFGFTKIIIEDYNKTKEQEIKDYCGGHIVLDDYGQIPDRVMKEDYINYAFNAMGMYYKIWKAHELMNSYCDENCINVDFVVRMRPDFIWFEEFDIENKIKDLKANEIMLIKDSYCTNARWMGNDKFFAGRKDVMDKYSNIISKIVDFHKMNKRIEGQHLARDMISYLKLKIIFVGSRKTYEKATNSTIKKHLGKRIANEINAAVEEYRKTHGIKNDIKLDDDE